MLRLDPVRQRPFVAAGSLAFATLLYSAPGVADNRVDVPAECGSAAEFDAELVRLLGAQASELSPYTLTITPDEAGGQYVLRMSFRGEQRELRDADCRTLFKSAVVVAAAAIKPDLARDDAQPPPPVPPSPAPPAERDSTPLAPAPAPSPEPRHVGLGVAAGAMAGLVPDVAPLLEISALAQSHGWGALLALRYTALSEAEAEGGRGVEVRAFGARVGASYSPVEVARLSAGLEVDLMVGRGTGVETPLSDAAWSVAPSLELTGILADIDGLRLELGLQGRWAVLRPRFHIEGYGDAYEVPAFGAAGLFRVAYLLF